MKLLPSIFLFPLLSLVGLETRAYVQDTIIKYTNAVAPEHKVDFVISGDNPNTTFTPNASTAEQASSSNTSAGGTISFGSGKKVEVAETPTSIEDKDGKIYAVDEQGKVTKAAEKTKETESLAGNMSTREKTTTEGKVAFSAYKNQSYAFDAYNPQYTNASEYANKYEEFGGEKVAVKAIAPGKPDRVSISFDGGMPIDSIYFLTPAGVRYRAEKDNGGYYLNLIGGEANETQEVYAMLPNRQDTTKPMTIGKLIVAAYPRVEKTVVLVPVNGAKVDTAGVLKKINEIYNPVNVYWTIKIPENFENKTWDIDKDDALNVTGSKWYTTYTEEMKALKTAYSQANNIEQRTLYMFVMKKAKTDNETSSKTIVGDMPRGKQFGFLFTEKADPATLAKTIAHELGHGYFQLKHPFEMGLTQNDLPTHLMDYGGGTEFNKYEWDLMHDPGIVTGLFESDTSGMYTLATHFSITYDILKENGVNDKVAKEIAYYASTYADYVTDPILIWGNEFLIRDSLEEYMKIDEGRFGSHERTRNSQNTEYIDINGGVFIHGMLAWWEGNYEETNPNIVKLFLACDKHYESILDKVYDGAIEDTKKLIISKLNDNPINNAFTMQKIVANISPESFAYINSANWKNILTNISSCNECKNRLRVFTSESNRKKDMKTATDRSLYGGLPTYSDQIEELSGHVHIIEGAVYVISKQAQSGKGFNNLSREEMKKIGLALHTIQDCNVHEGRRWDAKINNRVKALKMKEQDNHPTSKCLLSTNSDEAKKRTRYFIEVIKNLKK